MKMLEGFNNNVIVRARAPLRIGLAGGGTDVSPYSDIFGGAVLNATVNMYVYCTLVPRGDGKILFEATDRGESLECKADGELAFNGYLDLHKGVYARVMRDFCGGRRLGVSISTYSDAPAGSGLGTSSTIVVCLLKAFVEWLHLPLGEYDVAHLAYDIERNDVGLSGGKQDQYAATFGGFNFMEFGAKDKVIVNPLRVKRWIITELECSLLLYFMGTSRSSAQIISDQIKKTEKNDANSINAAHELKKQAFAMKDAVLTGNFTEFCECLREGWLSKKRISDSISNDDIDKCHDFIMKNGALAAKVSGAGGGGFMMIFCKPEKRKILADALNQLGGKTYAVNFDLNGTTGWVLHK